MERYKAYLVAKAFTKKEGNDYKEAYKEACSLISLKDSFRTIMALVAHFDLELHRMEIKIVFLNGDIDEIIYMVQLESFVLGDAKNMIHKLKKSIYVLKQPFRQWYYKFYQSYYLSLVNNLKILW